MRCTGASPQLMLGNPQQNAYEIIRICAANKDSDLIVFPECTITGYSVRDMVRQEALLKSSEEAIRKILLPLSRDWPTLTIVVGNQIAIRNSLKNVALVIQDGIIKGAQAKQSIPTYNEFEEQRWWPAGTEDDPIIIEYAGQRFPFGVDLIFVATSRKTGSVWHEDREGVDGEWSFAIDICEDVFMPNPNTSDAALAGALIGVNPSASPEQTQKHHYRKQLVANQSGRTIMGYIYTSSGPTESSTDVVFGGAIVIAENGHILQEQRAIGEGKVCFESRWLTQDIDVEYLRMSRRRTSSFAARNSSRKFRRVSIRTLNNTQDLKRHIPGLVYVPADNANMTERCNEILDLQAGGLIRKMISVTGDKNKPLDTWLPLSGGMDSTCALIATLRSYDYLNWDRKHLHCRTMPGFGTPGKTTKNAWKLMELTGVNRGEIDIKPLCVQTWIAMGYNPFIEYGVTPLKELWEKSGQIAHETADRFIRELEKLPKNAADLIFENVQAMTRTQVMKNLGFLIGTGCLSEGLVGWCTFLADQQSMYNVNISIPKTIEKWLIRHYADHMCSNKELANVLHDIANQEISPHLLPIKKGESQQSTEDILGPYEYIDFIGWYGIHQAFRPSKVLFLARNADWKEFKWDEDLFIRTGRTFYRRFFRNHFKRTNAPEGPKVGSFSISQRGDLRMPSDMSEEVWIEDFENGIKDK